MFPLVSFGIFQNAWFTHIFLVDENKAQEEGAADQSSKGSEAGEEDSKAVHSEKPALPTVDVSQLQQHMELPVVVDQKMIRDILGVKYLVEI